MHAGVRPQERPQEGCARAWEPNDEERTTWLGFHFTLEKVAGYFDPPEQVGRPILVYFAANEKMSTEPGIPFGKGEKFVLLREFLPFPRSGHGLGSQRPSQRRGQRSASFAMIFP